MLRNVARMDNAVAGIAEPLSAGRPRLDELIEALRDERVARSVALALRDVRICVRFDRLRAEGVRWEDAVEALRGPYTDDAGREYYLGVKGVEQVLRRRARRLRQEGKGVEAEATASGEA